MKMEETALLLPNAVCGIIITAIALMKVGPNLAIVLFNFSMIFLILNYINEWLKLTRKEFGPYTPPKWVPQAERMRTITLFILNLVVFFIFWFEPFIPPEEIQFWDMVTLLLIYGGFPVLILKWDFGKLGTELARHRLDEKIPE